MVSNHKMKDGYISIWYFLPYVIVLMVSNHKMKDGYWKYYHLAHTLERDAVVRNMASLVMENPPPRPEKKSKKGKKPVHSW